MRLPLFTLLLLCLPLSGCGSGFALPVHKVDQPRKDFEGLYRPNYLRSIEPARWPDGKVIRVRIRASGVTVLPWVVSTTRRGISLWSSVLSPHASIEFTDADTPDVDVVFVRPGSLQNGVIGRASPQYASPGVLSYCLIQLDASLAANPGLLMSVSCHEWGHCVGVGGHSPDESDIMYWRVPLPTNLTVSDSNTVRSIYNDRTAVDRSAAGQWSGCELKSPAP